MVGHATDLDDADLRILSALQEDGDISIAKLSAIVALSPNACWRRVRRLEDLRIIAKRVALLDAARIGLGITVFVSIRASEHSDEWFRRLSEAVLEIPEVVEFYRMAGDIDYLLKLRVASIAAYDAVYRRLIRKVNLTDVSSTFAMEEIKCTTALPLAHIS